jgi:DNA polymerase-2
MGGMVYQPTIGLHEDVAEVDFVSMYPSIMAHFHISPETVVLGEYDPRTGLPITRAQRGLVPETLQPLLEKRIAIKSQLLVLPKWDPRRKRYKAAASAHKWLLVTCFGYLGYKNARFGRIESHEAVTAFGVRSCCAPRKPLRTWGLKFCTCTWMGCGSKSPVP